MNMREFYRAAISRCVETGETLEDIISSGRPSVSGLPSGYAEIEYSDFDNAEAIDGARFDDANFSHYMER